MKQPLWIVWIANDWHSVSPAVMGNEYLRRCISLLQHGQILRQTCNGFSNAEWVLIFQAELQRRKRYGQNT